MQSPRPEQGSVMPGPIHWPVTRAEALAEQLQNVLSLKERETFLESDVKNVSIITQVE